MRDGVVPIKMLIIPAIDMKDHKVVRLKQGRLQDATVYRDNIMEQAEIFISQGVTRLHLVDLNGAFAGQAVHFDEILKIATQHPNIEIEVGGGIRDLNTVKKYFDAGVSFCILGTVAIKNPDVMREAAKEFPGKIILGVDAKDGLVATEGWGVTSSTRALDLVKNFHDCDIESVIYTDIAKDGMLQGMNFSTIEEMHEKCGFPVIASGGLSSLDDVRKLKNLKIHGVIAGKALYEGRFTLAELLQK